MTIRITALDALRGMAALAVVIFHFTMHYQVAGKLFFSTGCMGVDLFFVISGFVIFMTIERTKSWKDFVWNRFARLYPAYWACVSFTALLFVFKFKFLVHAQNNEVNGRYFLRYLANMTMIQYYFNIEDIDGPYWTLIIELLFYLFVIVIINLRKLNYISQTGFIISAFCACYSLPPFFNNYYIHALLVAIPLLAYFPLFYAGIILYKMKFGEVTIPKLAAFLSTFIFQCLMFTNCYKNHHLITIYQYIPALTLIYGLFLLFLYDKINFMVNPVTLWLGRISYSLYLFHQFIGIELLIPAFMKYLKLSFWPSAGLALCIVLILVNLINKYIERPSQIYLKNKNPFRSLTGNSLRMV